MTTTTDETQSTNAIEQFLGYLRRTSADKKDLFDGVSSQRVSVQVCLHKIPNLLNEKLVLCKLPHTLNEPDNLPEVCLIVKDVDRKDRDYDKTIRKYERILEANQLKSIVKQIIPLKQLNLEFRHFEAKRKLSTSFDLFLADKCLHDIIHNGSKLGTEFRKRRRFPIDVDMEDPVDLKRNVHDILGSTFIRLTGKGALIDIDAFLSTHSPAEALANIAAIRAELLRHLPGGAANIKAMFIKSTNTPAVPIYVDTVGTATSASVNAIKVPNNMTPRLVKKSKKLDVKRLQKQRNEREKKARKAAGLKSPKSSKKSSKAIGQKKKAKRPVDDE